MHVHHPESTVLEVGLWDRGEDGAIPLSVTDVFRGAEGGRDLLGTARVPLPKVNYRFLVVFFFGGGEGVIILCQCC